METRLKALESERHKKPLSQKSKYLCNTFYKKCLPNVTNRGTHTLEFSRKTTNAVLSDLQIVDM